MSSASGTTAAPWRPLFNTHISKMESPEFIFTSLEPAKDKNAVIPCVPRARTCVYRGMWAELPENKHQEAPMNERVYSSDSLTLTTDVRMNKIPQIVESVPGHEEVSGSGGGGPVEAVFWVKDVSTQWRFRGRAYIVGPDIEDDSISGVKLVKQEIGERMKVVKEEGKESWSWSTEFTAHFGNLSPGMRGSFKNPPPGTSVSVPPEEGLALGQKVNDLHDEIARKNFRVVIIKPDEVEQLDLTDPEKGRRWKFTYVGSDEQKDVDLGEWKKEELWP
ncbi:pyridoxamine 5'-phosphate oxidase-domain-containing protein [Calycina marina]|uniref:Pyridoxamine 5'-phosphate oxidase-domain-containing protein n=1 Tax=Calycina marina TaxID=1763456 RepID=A0A9P8CHK3_9HELO|nr:pyridoxamine 5'-phosphate oxidase-domain-containing protein [Calycina marina]